MSYSGRALKRFEDARLVTGAGAFVDTLGGSGVRHIDTPLTPEKVWRALHQRGG